MFSTSKADETIFYTLLKFSTCFIKPFTLTFTKMGLLLISLFSFIRSPIHNFALVCFTLNASITSSIVESQAISLLALALASSTYCKNYLLSPYSLFTSIWALRKKPWEWAYKTRLALTISTDSQVLTYEECLIVQYLWWILIAAWTSVGSISK